MQLEILNLKVKSIFKTGQILQHLELNILNAKIKLENAAAEREYRRMRAEKAILENTRISKGMATGNRREKMINQRWKDQRWKD